MATGLRVHVPASPDRCDGECPSRRTFLQQAIAGAVVTGAAVFVDGTALPIGRLEALASQADERKYPIPPSDGVSIDRDNQVILVRYQGAVYAFNLSCPHEQAALRWREGDARFQCPRHESKYHPDGVFISGRATRNMDRLGVRRDGDTLIVDVSRMFRSDNDAAAWAAAVIRL
jgi:nitrite reductase/ring-hydroxylating ferredoxin subunit